MKWLVRSRSPRDRSQYCRGLHTSGRETTASARRQCSARERRPVRTGSSVSLDTLFSKNFYPAVLAQPDDQRDKNKRSGVAPQDTHDVQSATQTCVHKQTIEKLVTPEEGRGAQGTVTPDQTIMTKEIQKLVTHKGAVSHRRGAIQMLVTQRVHES